MAELSTYLKVGTLSIVLELLEAGAELPKINLEDPVNTIKQVSRDMRVQESLKLTDGTSSTAIAVQRAYLKAAQRYFCHELNQVTKDVLVRWEDVLDRLEKDPRSLVRELDWVAKRCLIESYMDRKSCGWDDPRVRLMDLQYHDVRPEKGLYYTLERSHLIERIVLDHEIARAEMNPPVGTRAFSEVSACGSTRMSSTGRVGRPCCLISARTKSKNSLDGSSARNRGPDGGTFGPSGNRGGTVGKNFRPEYDTCMAHTPSLPHHDGSSFFDFLTHCHPELRPGLMDGAGPRATIPVDLSRAGTLSIPMAPRCWR